MNLLRTRQFVADSTLGRLAKWLRLMGFDTAFDAKPPDPYRLMALGGDSRLVLTRSQGVFHQLPDDKALLIRSEQPQKQIRQMILQLHIGRQELRPFTRCATCNDVPDYLSKENAVGLVPDYVLGHQQQFYQCPGCRRIYWSGSHCQRWMKMVAQWYEDLEN